MLLSFVIDRITSWIKCPPLSEGIIKRHKYRKHGLGLFIYKEVVFPVNEPDWQ
jgi:hypothetical protein